MEGIHPAKNVSSRLMIRRGNINDSTTVNYGGFHRQRVRASCRGICAGVQRVQFLQLWFRAGHDAGGIRRTVRHRTDPHGVVSRHPGCTGRCGRYLTPDGGDDLPPHAPEKGFESVSDDRGSGNQHLCSQFLYPALGRRGASVSIRLGQSRDPYRQYRHSQGGHSGRGFIRHHADPSLVFPVQDKNRSGNPGQRL